MKFFERSGGYWLFWWSAVYFIAGMLNIFVFKEQDWFPWVQVAWIGIIALPLFNKRLAMWLNMRTLWNNMSFLEFLGWKKLTDDTSNVLDFPKPKVVTPEPKPAPKEPDAKIFYRLGLTDNNRVAFNMGYSEITMNKEGCQQMIDQLAFFQSQLKDDDNE